MLAWLSGKKTYITAAGGVLLAVGGYLHGDITIGVAGQAVLTALIGAFLRSGVANS